MNRWRVVLLGLLVFSGCDQSMFRSLLRLEPPTDTFGCGPNAGAEDVLTGADPDGISVTWSSEALNEDGFVIERRQDGPWQEVGRTDEDATTYHDDSVTPDTAYSYRVRSYRVIDNQDCTSTPTSEIQQLSSPKPVLSLLGQGTSTTTVQLAWLDENVHPTAEYRVRRSVAGQGAIQVGTSTLPSFLDTALSVAVTYTYTVSAVNAGGGESAPQAIDVVPWQDPLLRWEGDPALDASCRLGGIL